MNQSEQSIDHLLEVGSKALRNAALNVEAKEYVLNNPVLFQTLKKAADRYIGGDTLEETIGKVILQNGERFKCSIEFMGESTQTEIEANQATQEFIRIAAEINKQQLHATISLDLSHIGLAVSKELCLRNLEAICVEAQKSNTEVIISAEDVEKTDAIIELYKKAHQKYDLLGITLQAYLHQTKADFEQLVKIPGRIRMVKGAFETPVGHSIPRGEELDQVYLDYVGQLLQQNHKCAIATHHDKIQQQVKILIEKYQPSKDSYEFESLYGIQTQQLVALRNEGHPTKIYFVYGKEWYLYLCNRIAEYPMNIFQALGDIVSVASNN